MSLGASHALDASVLALNRFYMAVHVISVRRAFCLLFKELAEVVTIDDGQYASFDFANLRESRWHGPSIKNQTTISSARSSLKSRYLALSGSSHTTAFRVKR